MTGRIATSQAARWGRDLSSHILSNRRWCSGHVAGREVSRCLGDGEKISSTEVRVGARRMSGLSKGDVERHRVGLSQVNAVSERTGGSQQGEQVPHLSASK